MLSAFDGLRKVVEVAGTTNIAKAAKGRFQQAAEETEQARKDFLSAAETYRMALAFLYNEAKNCENGITLERTPE